MEHLTNHQGHRKKIVTFNWIGRDLPQINKDEPEEEKTQKNAEENVDAIKPKITRKNKTLSTAIEAALQTSNENIAQMLTKMNKNLENAVRLKQVEN